LPHGKMKSREGTVVDADDLLDEMFLTALQKCKESEKLQQLNEEELNKTAKTVGHAALKYFMLKVDPKKKMLFNPAESVDFDGHTGPFIQYTYARTQSVLDKANADLSHSVQVTLNVHEREVLTTLYDFDNVVMESAGLYNPAIIANYVYELSKSFNRFYHECPIMKEENTDLRLFRLQLTALTGVAIHNGMKLLGIDVPQRM
jgi:arginyl-tRNA synthetase